MVARGGSTREANQDCAQLIHAKLTQGFITKFRRISMATHTVLPGADSSLIECLSGRMNSRSGAYLLGGHCLSDPDEAFEILE